MSINITVCGKFHYENYVPILEKRGVLNRVYFSHRITTTFGVTSFRRVNIFVKEYLLGAHLLMLRERGLRQMMVLYHYLWQVGLRFSYVPTFANIFLLHGNCLSLLKHHRRDPQTLVIGEVVNAHSRVLWGRLSKSAEKLGVPLPTELESVEKANEELKHIDYLLCPSKAVADSFIDAGFPEDRTWVIPYGVPVEANSPVGGRSKASSVIKIVCVGQIMLRKAQHLLIECLRDHGETLRTRFELTLIGRDDPAYLKRLRELEFPFEHIQHVSHQCLLDQLSDYDVLVMPSLEDGFGMTVVEAISARIPVVVSKFAGVSEVVAGRGDACIVDPFNGQEMAQAISRMIRYDQKSRDLEPRLASWDDYAHALCEKLQQAKSVKKFEVAV